MKLIALVACLGLAGQAAAAPQFSPPYRISPPAPSGAPVGPHHGRNGTISTGVPSVTPALGRRQDIGFYPTGSYPTGTAASGRPLRPRPTGPSGSFSPYPSATPLF